MRQSALEASTMSERDLLARSLAAVWHPCTQMKHHERVPLLAIARGEGPWLEDTAGRRFLDGISSWWTNLFGHCNPRINAALQDQLGRLEHAMLAGFTHEPVVALSERLSARTEGHLGHAFYASDGASATEIALKMSQHYWRNCGQPGKNRFLCLEGSYHGETVGALAVTDVAIFREAYAPLVRPAATVASPDARRAEPGETGADVARRAADQLEVTLARAHREIAALIVEPLIQGASGMVMYDPEYLRQARALCDRYGVHLIADEIAVGFGRSGSFFAYRQAGIRPDLLCLSKGISGGYLPLSTVLCTEDIYRAFYDDALGRAFLHSHSYTGNALACRAALAVLDIFDEDAVLDANRERARWMGEYAGELLAGRPVRHLRQRGMILAFDVAGADRDFPARYFAAGLDQGVLLRPIGETVYLMPPYVLDRALTRELVARAVRALDASLPPG
ncbi:MAG: adenosylmethionine--8-amino-7-oxononanoate transaminase [Rhodocyclaceae bacterium]|nr:adenosylmethionine--8-amino-7-oxononanoate transaminase [Rhodocyclaceae bacterium]